MDTNPYSSPGSTVIDEHNTDTAFHAPRRVAFSRGLAWVTEGFSHFTQNPGTWVLICIVGFVIMMALALIPVVGNISSLISAVWTGGLMLGCKAQDKGEGITVGHLFACFSNKFGWLVLLSVITTLLTLAVFVIVMVGVFLAYGLSLDKQGITDMFSSFASMMPFLVGFLVALALILPIAAMAWFAPALVVLNDVPLFKAFGMSFKGCMVNFLPFTLYGLALLLVLFIGVLPLGLGLLIVMPLFYGSMYQSYKDIYINS